MLFNELIQEFLFDCKIRDLSEVTIYNYSKQLSLFERYLSEKYFYAVVLLIPHSLASSVRLNAPFLYAG